MKNEVKLLKALADETRLTIVEFLKGGKEKCVYEIIPVTGKSQPTVSQHLKILREAGVLKFRKGPLEEPVASKFKKRVKKEERYCYYYSVRDEKIFELIKTLKEVAGRV